MDPEGARTFQTTGDAYDLFMGRYSRSLARPFADAAGLAAGQNVLDVGCGPGALTTELARRLGTDAVVAVDPSPPFVAACAARVPGVQVRQGRAEQLPFPDGSFDRVMAQLVLHFVADPPAAAREFRRVLRPRGVVAACAWDAAEGMQMLRAFWGAARRVDDGEVAMAEALRFGRDGEITELFDAAGLVDVRETVLEVTSTYSGFDELWAGFLTGIGPAGTFLVSLDGPRRAVLRAATFEHLGSPSGSFALTATARCAMGAHPER